MAGEQQAEHPSSSDVSNQSNIGTPHRLENGEEVEVLNFEPGDPTNPFNWSLKRKWLLTITTCFISILTGLPAGSYGAGDDAMSKEFNVDNSSFPYLYFATSTWNMGAALAPLIFVPLSELVGRMYGYFVAYIVFCIFLIPSAVAKNFATIAVTRFFGGGASSVSINIVGGTITDLFFTDQDRGLPMSIFGFTSVVGIALGPFIGGAITTHLSWRWIYWIQLIFDGGCLPIFWLILSETRGDVILTNRAKKLRKETGRKIYAKAELESTSLKESMIESFRRPTVMLFTELVVFSFSLWISFVWGVLYLFQTSVAQTFAHNYGFSTMQTGMVQLAISVGAVIGTALNPIQDKLYMQSAKRNKENPGRPIPEARVYSSVLGSLLFTAGLFWYGWANYSDVPWIVPTLGIGCVGVGIYSVYMAVVNYFSDAYQKYTASALAAASLGRNTFGAFLPLASQSMYTNLGYQWASSLLGFIGLILTLAPIIILWKGKTLRAKSPFMTVSTLDEGEHEHRAQERRQIEHHDDVEKV